MVKNGLAGECQSQPQTIPAAGNKGLKEPRAHGSGNTWTCIINTNQDVIFPSLRVYVYPATIRHRFQRIADQIEKYSFDPRAFKW